MDKVFEMENNQINEPLSEDRKKKLEAMKLALKKTIENSPDLAEQLRIREEQIKKQEEKKQEEKRQQLERKRQARQDFIDTLNKSSDTEILIQIAVLLYDIKQKMK